MLDENLIKVCSKIYVYKNTDSYDFEKEVSIYKVPQSLSDKEKSLLESSGFKLNDIEFFDHDTTIKNLKELAREKGLEQKVYSLFIKAVGQGFHRGLQPIVSYSFAKNIPSHSYIPIEENGLQYRENERPCKICGLPKSKWGNSSENLYHLYIGYCRIGAYFEMLTDLKEVRSFPSEEIVKGNLETFEKLVDLIQDASEKETPTDLINRISKAKILPKSNNVSRTWLVRILAELGVLNNKLVENYNALNQYIPYQDKLELELQLHKEAPNHRTEVSFPISAWRGELGVNPEIVKQITNFDEKQA